MPKDLSLTMEEACQYAREHGGRLVRYLGGYWAKEGWNQHGQWFGTTTVEALVSRGVATYTKHKKGRNGEFPIEVTLVEAKANG